MDRRLLTLLVAVLCAVGWVPMRGLAVSGDRAIAGESVGVLPGRRQSPSKLELELELDHDDDEPVCLPATLAMVVAGNGVAIAPAAPLPAEPIRRPLWSAAGARGPPRLA